MLEEHVWISEIIRDRADYVAGILSRSREVEAKVSFPRVNGNRIARLGENERQIQ